jgi:hypothetical protein
MFVQIGSVKSQDREFQHHQLAKGGHRDGRINQKVPVPVTA